MKESRMQYEIIKFAWNSGDERLKLLHASLNGAVLAGGGRQGAMLKSSGLKNGIPDLFLPVPSGNWHGFYIELKTENGVVSEIQEKVISQLRKQHYRVEIIRSVDDAIKQLVEYVKFALY